MRTGGANRTVLITGAAKGIGLASAIAFAENGDRVYASARDLSGAVALRDAIERYPDHIVQIELDVTSPPSIERAVDDISKHGRALDVVVNNAGILRTGAFETLTDAEIRKVMETNFFGVLNVTRCVLPIMRAQGSGQILMMSSLSGWAGLAGDSIYAASKFALEGFTEALRHEVARWGIRLDLIEPAGFRTGLSSEAWELISCGDDAYASLNQRLRDHIEQSADQGGAPEEVARELVEISHAQTDQFRWPIGDVAAQIQSKLFACDDAQRDEMLRSASQIDWWLGSDSGRGSN